MPPRDNQARNFQVTKLPLSNEGDPKILQGSYTGYKWIMTIVAVVAVIGMVTAAVIYVLNKARVAADPEISEEFVVPVDSPNETPE